MTPPMLGNGSKCLDGVEGAWAAVANATPNVGERKHPVQ